MCTTHFETSATSIPTSPRTYGRKARILLHRAETAGCWSRWIIGIIVLAAGLLNCEGQSGWVPGWRYRQSHVIQQTPGAGTEYQIKLRVQSDEPPPLSKFTNLSKYAGNPL